MTETACCLRLSACWGPGGGGRAWIRSSRRAVSGRGQQGAEELRQGQMGNPKGTRGPVSGA